jgi:DNA modification methylase
MRSKLTQQVAPSVVAQQKTIGWPISANAEEGISEETWQNVKPRRRRKKLSKTDAVTIVPGAEVTSKIAKIANIDITTLGENTVKVSASEYLWLELGSDKKLRRDLFTTRSFYHPAKLHLILLKWILSRYTKAGDLIIDPMAGSGSTMYAALAQCHVLLRDVEPWCVELMQQNFKKIQRAANLLWTNVEISQADARLPWPASTEFANRSPDVILTSPPYGCAISAKPNGRAGFLSNKAKKVEAANFSERWAKLLANETPGAMGSQLFHYGTANGQMGHLRGVRYWAVMATIYTQAFFTVKPGGLLILIVKDHIRKGKWVNTADQTVELCQRLGFEFIERHKRIIKNPSLWQRRLREQGQPIVGWEDILVFRKPQKIEEEANTIYV